MKQQRGSALIISLLILLVMTIIGISAMSSSTLEEKMAASDRNQKAIFQNAETSLKQAETTLLQADYNSVIQGALVNKQQGYYTEDAPRFDYLNPSAWDASSNCIAIPNNSNNQGSSCYVIEESALILPPGEAGEYGQTSSPVRGNQIARITVRSTDSNGMSAATLQSSVQKVIY